MKYTLLAYVSTLLLIYLTFKFGWSIANWLNNLAANWGCRLGEIWQA